MRVSIIKKLMTGALVASMLMASVIGVSATGTRPSYYGPVVASVAEEAAPSGWAEVEATSSVNGLRSTVGGVFFAKKVNGVAVTTPLATIAAAYGLAGNERPYVKVLDMDPKRSYAAKAVMDFVAASQGAEVGPMLNIEFGKMSGGKYSLLPSDGADIRFAVGLPGNFSGTGHTYAVVCVRTGGTFSILPDLDSNPNTITFDTKGGAGAYAVIRY